MSPSQKEESSDIESLRSRWRHLYASHLPALALARDPVQARWPVHLDHCFARIVLDNAVGADKPWNQTVKAPAVKNMTVEQLRDALALGERVANGEADLVELDWRSLELRGKGGKKYGGEAGKSERAKVGEKRKTEDAVISKYFAPKGETSPPRRKRIKIEGGVEEENGDGKEPSDSKSSIKTETDLGDSKTTTSTDKAMAVHITRIQSSTTLTPFRKQTLTLLCQIPPGRWSTYQAMSDHITATSHKTCARAVGNAMRNNPFAPDVPCHRILSSDGSIGGFGGHWGEEGKYAGKKKDLLGDEGVKFDSKGKVKGQAFRDFGK